VSNDPIQPPVPPPPPDPTAPIPARPPGEPPPSQSGSRRIWIVVAGIVAVVAVVGTIAAIALSGDDDNRAGQGPTGEPSVTLPSSPSETTGLTPQPTGSTGTTGSANPGCSGAPAPATLADGRYFGFVESVDLDSGTMGFDLACFYSGEEANEQAAQRGDEVPVPNDVYIVNDNTTIRDVPLDPSTELLLIDWNECCETSPGAELDALASAIGEQDFVEIGGRQYAGSLSPYWVTIENGQVVLIEEQFLP
jgi:hypothetical protein